MLLVTLDCLEVLNLPCSIKAKTPVKLEVKPEVTIVFKQGLTRSTALSAAGALLWLS
jgi:hypothetical protein